MQNTHKLTLKLLHSPPKPTPKIKNPHDASLSISSFPAECNTFEPSTDSAVKTFRSSRKTLPSSSNISPKMSNTQPKPLHVEPTKPCCKSTKSTSSPKRSLKKNESTASIHPIDGQVDTFAHDSIGEFHMASASSESDRRKDSMDDFPSGKSDPRDTKTGKNRSTPTKSGTPFYLSNSTTPSSGRSSSQGRRGEALKAGNKNDASNLLSLHISTEDKRGKGLISPLKKAKSSFQNNPLRVRKDLGSLDTTPSPTVTEKGRPYRALGENDESSPLDCRAYPKNSSSRGLSNIGLTDGQCSQIGSVVEQDLFLAGFRSTDRENESLTIDKGQRLLRDYAQNANTDDSQLRIKETEKQQSKSLPVMMCCNYSYGSCSEVVIPMPSSIAIAEVCQAVQNTTNLAQSFHPLEPLFVKTDETQDEKTHSIRNLSPSAFSSSVNLLAVSAQGPDAHDTDKSLAAVKAVGAAEGGPTCPVSSTGDSTDPSIPAAGLSRFQSPPIPLHNYGNTCYMNATLQCLLHTPHFLSMLQVDAERVKQAVGKKNEDEREGCPCECAPATESFIGLALCDAKSEPETFLLKIKDIAAARNEQFSNGQNDAHEFLRTILHEIHEEINRRRSDRAPYEEIKNIPKETEEEAMARWMIHLRSLDDSTVYDFFGGVLCTRCECMNCENVSLAFDPFLDLSLPIAPTPTTPVSRGKTPKSTKSSEKGSSFQFFSSKSSREEKSHKNTAEAVDIVLRESYMPDMYEMLTGGNQLFCDKCKKLCDGRRISHVALWPRILVLHLKRFDGSGKKNSASIIYPNSFMLNKLRYRLYAVCCHSGSESCGHYTNYVCLDVVSDVASPTKQGDASVTPGGDRTSQPSNGCAFTAGSPLGARLWGATSEKWYLCNDRCISEVDAKTAFSALANAYILFYCRQ